VRRADDVREIYRRDAVGNLVEKRDASGATLLAVKPTADRLVAERQLASGGIQRFAYNAAASALPTNRNPARRIGQVSRR
jgi:hypothetical protein